MCRCRRQFLLAIWNLTWLTVCAGTAQGYPVAPSVPLETLTLEADIIFKGTVVSSEPGDVNWFSPYQGFVARQTQFKIISVIKGETPGDTLTFRHYDLDPRRMGYMFQPQYYHFEPGKTYLVFAANGGATGVFRQVWMHRKAKEDQGVLWCADDKPVTGKTLKDILWRESDHDARRR